MIVQLLEVLIGLSLVFVIFSSIATALVEAVEMVRQRRGKYLEAGIKEILRAIAGQGGEDDAKTFYESPFVSSLFRGDYATKSKTLPSYIPAERFADAVLQLARDDHATFKRFVERMRQAVDLPADAADLAPVKAQTIRYYNESMERVSGWYQREARRWLLVIGLSIAALANVDTLQIMSILSQEDILREQVVEAAARKVSESIPAPGNTLDQQRAYVEQQLKLVDSLGLPIGWTQPEVCRVFLFECPEPNSEEGRREEARWFSFLGSAPFLSKLLGILLTGFALTFGAQVWFDLLSQLVNLRTSLKPKAAHKEETATAAEGKAKDPTAGEGVGTVTE